VFAHVCKLTARGAFSQPIPRPVGREI
jgi:hypothetical protein